MTNSIPLGQLETGPSAQWVKIGDTYRGRITSMEERQQTDPKDQSPKFFKSGAPMMVLVITIEQDNGDTVALYASGGAYRVAEGEGQAMKPAIGAALRAAGASALDAGAELAVSFTGWGEPTAPGLNPPRLFSAQYRPATAAPTSVPVDLFTS
jgi:hypothetical protein